MSSIISELYLTLSNIKHYKPEKYFIITYKKYYYKECASSEPITCSLTFIEYVKKSLDHFYIERHYMKIDKASWTYSSSDSNCNKTEVQVIAV